MSTGVLERLKKVIVNHEGQDYLIENWPEFKKKLLNGIAFQLESEIVKDINRMKLVKKGNLKKVDTVVEGDMVVITFPFAVTDKGDNYAVYLEFGTYDYWKRFGELGFPDPGYPSIPKKKELSSKQRKMLPKGMQPFSFIRRTLYNPKKMDVIIQRAVKSASK